MSDEIIRNVKGVAMKTIGYAIQKVVRVKENASFGGVRK